MLTVTVNQRRTFRSADLSKAKQMASKIANAFAKESDWMRVYVSSGNVIVDGEVYGPGTELKLKRLNQLKPKYKSGKWLIDRIVPAED